MCENSSQVSKGFAKCRSSMQRTVMGMTESGKGLVCPVHDRRDCTYQTKNKRSTLYNYKNITYISF